MTPDGLRCESRRTGGLGLWRYSMAAVIVLAAMLDVVWWVPAHERAAQERAAHAAAIQATTPRCRAAQYRREIQRLEAELARLNAELRALDVQVGELHAQ